MSFRFPLNATHTHKMGGGTIPKSEELRAPPVSPGRFLPRPSNSWPLGHLKERQTMGVSCCVSCSIGMMDSLAGRSVRVPRLVCDAAPALELKTKRIVTAIFVWVGAGGVVV